MGPRVKIRGIYSTALTGLLLDAGFSIADPSPEIRDRFRLPAAARGDSPDVFIQDRRDLQGVTLIGEADRVCPLVRLFQQKLLDAALLEFAPVSEEVAEEFASEEARPLRDIDRAYFEFAGAAKQVLDRVRSSVLPTVANHHRLQIIRPKVLAAAEKKLGDRQENKRKLERDLFLEEVIFPLQKAGPVRLEHIKPSGKPIRPREGVLLEANPQSITVKRFFSQGRYDGLDLPIEKGDFCVSEVREKAWYIKHSYYDQKEHLKGEYYNINTPVELYPYGARYLDLEIDVIRRAGEKPRLIDRQELSLLTRKGLIAPRLENKAAKVAEEIMERLAKERRRKAFTAEAQKTLSSKN